MRILFVGMSNSIHLVRWIQQLEVTGWDIHLFPVENVHPHPSLRNVTLHDQPSRNIALSAMQVAVRDEFWPKFGMNWPFGRGASWAKRHSSRWFHWFDRACRLAETIKRLQPDVTHSHEFQHAAYLTLDAKERLDGPFPPWIVSNWGHDIYLFSRLSAHRAKINAVLQACDYYTCECRRDVALAQSFGLNGEVLGVVPNCGGFDVKAASALRQAGPTSARRTIALKGYQNYYGRAIHGLRGIELAADVLKEYRIAIYSTTEDVRIAAELMAHSTGLNIELIPHSTNEDILRLHGACRISLGVSISDAASISMLEAMIMGSFPIQTDSSCANEWIVCGKSGFLVPAEDPYLIAKAIRRAVSDDELVDTAAEINAVTVMARVDKSVIQPKVISMYEKVAADSVKLKEAKPI